MNFVLNKPFLQTFLVSHLLKIIVHYPDSIQLGTQIIMFHLNICSILILKLLVFQTCQTLTSS